MPILEFPAGASFRTVRWSLRTHTTSFKSPTNNAMQTLELPGAQWVGTFEVNRMTLITAGAWKAFVLELAGPAGRFHGYDPSQLRPNGAFDAVTDTLGGNPVRVDGGSQTGKTLLTKNWRLSGTNLLLPGDTLSVEILDPTADAVKRIHMVTAAVNSDGTGDASISITPALAGSPAADANITFLTPKVRMMLVDDGQGSWSVPVNKLISGFSFTGIEVH